MRKAFEIHTLTDQASFFDYLWELESSVLTDCTYTFCNIDHPEVLRVHVWHNGTHWDFKPVMVEKQPVPKNYVECSGCGSVKHKKLTCGTCDYFERNNNINQ